MRKIRAYYRGLKCNAAVRLIFARRTFSRVIHIWSSIPRLILGRLLLSLFQNLTAHPSYKAVEVLIFGLTVMCVSSDNAHYGHNAFYVFRFREGNLLSDRIAHVKNHAAKGTRQAVQRKGAGMLLEESQNLGLLPAPDLPKFCRVSTEPNLPYWIAGASKEKALP